MMNLVALPGGLRSDLPMRKTDVLPAGTATDSSETLVAGRFYDDPLIFADFFETGKTTSLSSSWISARTDTGR
jgi:hypothetical protein